MTWKPDPRHERKIGDFVLVPERRDSETAHRVYSPQDGRGIRVLPCDHATGQKRSRIILSALTALDDVWVNECGHDDDHREFDPYLYLTGALASAAIPWESTGDPETIDEWLEAWFEARDVPGWFDLDLHGRLLRDLEADGWEIVKGGGE